MQTPQGEQLRLRPVGYRWVVELQSPVHGQWIIVEDLTLYEQACERVKSWITGHAP